MKQGFALKQQAHSGVFVIIALGFLVLAAFFFLWIQPAFKSIDLYDDRIEELQFKIEKQKRLVPLYKQLAKRKKTELPPALIIPARTKLAKAEIDAILSGFREMADKSGLAMVAVKPDLGMLEENPGLITVDAVVRGTFFALRGFLFDVAKIPYLEKIEEIFIKQVGDEREITVKLWLAVE